MMLVSRSPRNVPKIVPFPPDRLAPPTTTAAMMRSSAPLPAIGEADPVFAAAMTPESAESAPVKTYIQMRTLSTLMPESFAASSFPPT